MRFVLHLHAAVLTALATVAAPAAPASAQDAPRQTFEAALTSERPAAPSGFTEAIDYVPPGGPDGKPYAVQTVRLTLPAGSRFDTSVPERCGASDLEFQQQGTAACPPGSRVGGGDVEVDVGRAVGTIPRIVRLRATLFNDEGTVIVFFESTNTEPRLRSVARSPIEGTTVTTEAPPLPGFPPPDPFLAVRTVRIAFEEIARGGRAYITTPAMCPASGRWTTTATFTYRDGVTETAAADSPCAREAATSRRPRATLRGVPRRRCARRDFTVAARVRAPAGLRVARLYVDRRLVRRTRKRRFSQRIDIDALSLGRHRLRVVAVDRDGATARTSRRFNRCRRAPAFAG